MGTITAAAWQLEAGQSLESSSSLNLVLHIPFVDFLRWEMFYVLVLREEGNFSYLCVVPSPFGAIADWDRGQPLVQLPFNSTWIAPETADLGGRTPTGKMGALGSRCGGCGTGCTAIGAWLYVGAGVTKLTDTTGGGLGGGMAKSKLTARGTTSVGGMDSRTGPPALSKPAARGVKVDCVRGGGAEEVQVDEWPDATDGGGGNPGDLTPDGGIGVGGVGATCRCVCGGVTSMNEAVDAADMELKLCEPLLLCEPIMVWWAPLWKAEPAQLCKKSLPEHARAVDLVKEGL
eukprot:CAMPEP_0178405856 /NCGR_PEP_ID=MMETSP0689_2-20121128/18613_1 /TAXON_ID=160604 /ORGANISM="Amphidinium massartii, Strain CS-259" /LENGTH=288 /DNA_ID=CAMNT_0020026881 /DNA_START=135 /DNA_END=1004 /DNA_ORIENTATION=-